jgi:hypothetical protein
VEEFINKTIWLTLEILCVYFVSDIFGAGREMPLGDLQKNFA